MLELAEAHGIIVYLQVCLLNDEEAAEHRKNLREDLEALDKQLCKEYYNNN